MKLHIDENNALVNSTSNIIPCYVYTGSRNNYQPATIEDAATAQKVLDFMDNKRNSPL